MYSTCLFCTSGLGRNTEIAPFPVGRRLAFDPARGRLWVVCRSCERWNLSALDERWEAIDECERFYRDTRLRVSTENIGLARLRDGLELVRIGEPQRPELAAWRYGDQFGRRRRVAMVRTGLAIGFAGGMVAGGAAAGIGLGALIGVVSGLSRRIMEGSPDKVVARLSVESDQIKVRRKHLPKVLLVSPVKGAEWGLEVKVSSVQVRVVGPEAIHAASQLLPAINRFGGNRRQVRTAVDLVERAGAPEAVFGEAASLHRRAAPRKLTELPYPVRLAMEMAAHEDAERRALEGELALLEAAWREAEEVATISDSLLLPAGVEDRIRGAREGRCPPNAGTT